MPFMELEDFEERGRKLRRLLSIDDQAQPDMMTMLVKLKHHGVITNYERVPVSALPEDEAMWDPERRVIRLREDIFCAANKTIPDPRARWTVAHEIGHAWLGHQHARNRNVSNRRIERIAPSIKRDERQAHGVAAALLAPARFVSDPISASAEQIATQFNISLRAARTRKLELEQMYRRVHGIARPLPQSIVSYLNDRKK